MNRTTRNGLLALAGAALAYWQFKMTPEQKARVKGKVSDAGKQLSERIPQSLKEVSSKVTERFNARNHHSNNRVDQPAHL